MLTAKANAISTRKIYPKKWTASLKDRRSYLANAAEGGDILPLTANREEGVTAQIIVLSFRAEICLGAVALLPEKRAPGSTATVSTLPGLRRIFSRINSTERP